MTSNFSPEDTALLAGYLSRGKNALRDHEREHIIAICGNIITSLETPIETARKNAFLALDEAVIQTALRLNLLSVLDAGNETEEKVFSVAELAARTKPPCSPLLLSRFLRYLAQPLHLVLEKGPDQWSLSESGRVLALQGYSASCKLYSRSCGPAFRALPSWMAFSPDDCSAMRPANPFKAAMPHIEGDFFDWLREDAEGLHDFHTWMHTLAEQQYDCQQKVDFTEFIPRKITSAETAFVDIGGGSGTQCITLRQKCGQNMHGKIFNQDRPEVVADVGSKLERAGIQVIAHDFFTEQPIRGTYCRRRTNTDFGPLLMQIQGAHVYHFRQILHDWPDEDCVKILRLTRNAMTKQSTLLIDEVVMPQQGAHWMVTQRDLTMLALFNAGERTEEQWRSLLMESGLMLEEIRTYDTRMAASLLVARLQ